MKNRKNILYLIRDNKKKVAAVTMFAVCLCTYCVAGGNFTKETSTNDIPLHDGDVLVTSDDVTELENTDTYFNELRATLDMDRNKILAMLDEKEKMKLLKYMEQEKTIETLIKNKGLPDSFVVITDSGVNVTVNTEKLDQSTVTKICEIIMRQTDRKASEIVVQDAS